MKQLFFDDEKLFGRENVTRTYGTPQLEAVYFDGMVSTDYFSPWVFSGTDGKTRMIYYGTHIESGKKVCLIAISEDGVHFTPEDTTDKVELTDRIVPHELFKPGAEGDEIADIYEDLHAAPEQRYKMLVCAMNSITLSMDNLLYTSPDLYSWTLQPVNWGVGNEPLGDVFYNSKRSCHTVLLRPFWGIRRAGYSETTDWKTFSPFVPCIQPDSLDAPLTEIYGMPAIEYGGMYIGFPHLYHNLKSAHNAKFFGGDMGTQLAYSYEGRYWLRSLRQPFLDGKTAAETLGYDNHMIWLAEAKPQPNGDILLYAAATQLEHGPAFREAGCTSTVCGRTASSALPPKMWRSPPSSLPGKRSGTAASCRSTCRHRPPPLLCGNPTIVKAQTHWDFPIRWTATATKTVSPSPATVPHGRRHSETAKRCPSWPVKRCCLKYVLQTARFGRWRAISPTYTTHRRHGTACWACCRRNGPDKQKPSGVLFPALRTAFLCNKKNGYAIYSGEQFIQPAAAAEQIDVQHQLIAGSDI